MTWQKIGIYIHWPFCLSKCPYCDFVSYPMCSFKKTFSEESFFKAYQRDMDIFLEPLKTKMKLWDDSIKELDISNECLKRIRPALNKYYVPHQTDREKHQLDRLIILGVHNQPDYRTQKLFEFEKYNALRSQIYRKLYLKGMPETEKKYFKQLLQIAQSIDVTMVWRPKICKIHETMDFIKDTLAL